MQKGEQEVVGEFNISLGHVFIFHIFVEKFYKINLRLRLLSLGLPGLLELLYKVPVLLARSQEPSTAIVILFILSY